MPSRCCEFVDSRLRRSPPDRTSAVPYGQAGENAMRFPHLAHRSAAAHKLHSTSQQQRMNLISGNDQTSSRLPAFSLSLPGSCPNNRDRRKREKAPCHLRRRLTRTIGIISQNRRALSLSALAAVDLVLRASWRTVEADIAPFARPQARFPTERLQHGSRIPTDGAAALPDRLGLRENGGEFPSTSVPPCPGVRLVRLARPPYSPALIPACAIRILRADAPD